MAAIVTLLAECAACRRFQHRNQYLTEAEPGFLAKIVKGAFAPEPLVLYLEADTDASVSTVTSSLERRHLCREGQDPCTDVPPFLHDLRGLERLRGITRFEDAQQRVSAWTVVGA